MSKHSKLNFVVVVATVCVRKKCRLISSSGLDDGDYDCCCCYCCCCCCCCASSFSSSGTPVSCFYRYCYYIRAATVITTVLLLMPQSLRLAFVPVPPTLFARLVNNFILLFFFNFNLFFYFYFRKIMINSRVSDRTMLNNGQNKFPNNATTTTTATAITPTGPEIYWATLSRLLCPTRRHGRRHNPGCC